MTYGSATCGGIYMRTSKTPWGPWSYESPIFQNTPNRGWEGKIVHDPNGSNPDFNSQPVIYDGTKPCCVSMSAIGIAPWGLPGNPYAPFLLPVQDDNGDNTVKVYMNLSTFDPYVVFLVGFDVQKPR